MAPGKLRGQKKFVDLLQEVQNEGVELATNGSISVPAWDDIARRTAHRSLAHTRSLLASARRGELEDIQFHPRLSGRCSV